MLKITSESIATFLSRMQSNNTKNSYSTSLKFFVSVCGDVLNQETLLEYRSHLLSTKVASSTINNRIAALLSYAKFNSVHLYSPALKYKPAEIQPLSEPEINHLLSNLTPDKQLVVQTLLATGLRISEFSWLSSQKINVGSIPPWMSITSGSSATSPATSIVTSPALESVIITGKGNKQRTVFFKPELGSILYHNILTTNTLFGKKWSAITVRRFLVKINSRIHPHIFRHTFAIKALRKGCTMVSLAKMLGHSNISTTQIYVNYSDREMREAWGSI